MSDVFLVECKSYDRAKIQAAVRRVVDLAGGMSEFIKPGERVLIKPNMLSAHAPGHRVTTDPEVVRVVTELVLEAGGKPFIGDSPAMESIKRVGAKTGIAQVAADLGVPLEGLTDPVRIKSDESFVFRSLELSRLALEADKIINLPKLKTHGQMYMTLGVKNLFGTIVAQRKAEWHLIAGLQRDNFASMLLDIYQALTPALTIMDGVWGMDGAGPANGNPIRINLVAAAVDCVALDVGLCHLLGLPLSRFPLYRVAMDRNIGQTDVQKINFLGDTELNLKGVNFDAPALDSIKFLPSSLDWFSKRYMVSKPIQNQAGCTSCSKCVDICPAVALELDGKKLGFDYDKCIRCYCCQEVCPEGSVLIKKGILVRVLNLLNR